jgi:hypothetical protein
LLVIYGRVFSSPEKTSDKLEVAKKMEVFWLFIKIRIQFFCSFILHVISTLTTDSLKCELY